MERVCRRSVQGGVRKEGVVIGVEDRRAEGVLAMGVMKTSAPFTAHKK